MLFEPCRQSQFEQRKAFQRLVYLSYIVFGEQKAAFLLPWRRVFNLTDAQLFVARRDNARAIFSGHLAARGGEFPAERCAGAQQLDLRYLGQRWSKFMSQQLATGLVWSGCIFWCMHVAV
jgi:hypothetical protein